MKEKRSLILRCSCAALAVLFFFLTGCQTGSPDSDKIKPLEIEVGKMYKNSLEKMPATTYGDPFIMRFDGYYYMYTTPSSTVMEVQRSEDLVNWEMIGRITSDHVMNHAYAPEVVYYNGKFYLCASPGGNGHYIMSADRPEGPFVRETNNFGMCIDGSFFIDDDGSWYFYNATGENIEARRMTSPTRVQTQIFRLGTSLKHWTEGPMVIKRGGIYYLTYTGNHFRSKGYRVSYATSTKSPLGPFEISTDNPIIISTEEGFSNLGHSSSFLGPDLDSWYIAYHNMQNARLNIRRPNIDRLSFNGKRMYVNGPCNFPQPEPMKPRFSTRGTDAFRQEKWADFSLYSSPEKTGQVFTAEFNITKAFNSAVVLGYKDSSNFWFVIWNQEDSFDIVEVSKGNQQTRASFTLPGSFNPNVLHCLRIASDGSNVEIFFDNMKRFSGQLSIPAGAIGYLVQDDAIIGFTAFSDFAFGSSDQHAVYNLPSAFAAVNHAPASAGGASKNLKYNSADTSRSVLLSAGDFISFAANAGYSGPYRIGLECSDSTEDFEIEIYEDAILVGSFKSSELVFPKEGMDGWKYILLGTVNLKQGVHTFSLRLKSGSMELRTIRVDTASQLADTIQIPLTEKSQLMNCLPDTPSIFFNDLGLSTRLTDAKICSVVENYTDFIASVTISGIDKLRNYETTGLVVRMSKASFHENQLKEAFFGYLVSVGKRDITLIHNRYENQRILGRYRLSETIETARLEVRAEGARISVYLDGNLIIEADDPYPIPTGGAGIVFYSSGSLPLEVIYRDLEIKPL